MKRKEQNRAAQRAFRERKERHVKDVSSRPLNLRFLGVPRLPINPGIFTDALYPDHRVLIGRHASLARGQSVHP